MNMSIRACVDGYRAKRFSPTEVVKESLRRIRASNDALHAFITVDEASALRMADIAERQWLAGCERPLLGVPLSYKDNIDTRAMRTTYGSRIDADHVPARNAFVVDCLERAGAVTVGKTNLYEYAFGITSDNPFYGDVGNPWHPRLIAGGSSSGSAAAVAVGWGLGSIGTDTAGSIRVPAACCGIVGLKPTHGWIDMDGILPLSWTLDHAGPMANDVADVALLLGAFTGRPVAVPRRADIRGRRVGVPARWLEARLDDGVRRRFEASLDTLREAGAIVFETDMPFEPDEAVHVAHTIATGEVAYVHRSRVETSRHLYGPGSADVFDKSRTLGAVDYIAALRRREEMAAGVQALFEEADVLAMPTTPGPAPALGAVEAAFGGEVESVAEAMIRFTAPFNVTGHPALSMPCGLANGVPVGLQLVAGRHREDALLQVAFAYEEAALSDFYAERAKLAANFE